MSEKRQAKEQKILNAAVEVFQNLGFQNTKMSAIADAAGISKGTVYFYFKSKENLYMAIVENAFKMLNDQLQTVVENNQSNSGIQSVSALFNTYMRFSQEHQFYTTAMLDYMALQRNTQGGKDKLKVSKALTESAYFKNLKNIHNVPVSLVVGEIIRGKSDGSISNPHSPEIMYLTAWAITLGYLKLSQIGASSKQTIYRVPIAEWRLHLQQTILDYMKI